MDVVNNKRIEQVCRFIVVSLLFTGKHVVRWPYVYVLWCAQCNWGTVCV